MESQNHFYGHSAGLAAYLGRERPSHISGLVQHGWTAMSPVRSHFRDFPNISGRGRHRLLVWSHASRAWSPSDENRQTTAIGAQFVYLAAASGQPPTPRDERDRVVLMPLHGIQTQRVRGDHAGLAQMWREKEGPATACLYAADVEDPEILGAYRAAGHRVVMLGERLDPQFLWRLWTLLGRADRVVSNRLSTPVFYAAHLGADVAIYGDSLRVDGEGASTAEEYRRTWPELHGEHLDREAVRALCERELGVQYLRPARELEQLLGWHGSTLPAAVEYWTTSPTQRAVINLRRRAGSAAASRDEVAHAPMRLGPWLRAATSYLPGRLPRAIPRPGAICEPIVVS